MYSRGRSHVARLAVAVHFLLSFWEAYERDVANSSSRENQLENEDQNRSETELPTTDHSDAPAGIEQDQSNTEDDSREDIEDEEIEDEDDDNNMHYSEETDFDSKEAATFIGRAAVEIASSIVTTCLTQLCKFTFVN